MKQSDILNSVQNNQAKPMAGSKITFFLKKSANFLLKVMYSLIRLYQNSDVREYMTNVCKRGSTSKISLYFVHILSNLINLMKTARLTREEL